MSDEGERPEAAEGELEILGESERIVTVERFFSTAEAHAACMALENAGITANVADEFLGGMYGVAVGSRLQVRATDEAAAREVLGAMPASGEDLPAEIAEPPCPACGSRSVLPEAWVAESEDDDARRNGSRRKWYYVCGDCHEAWPA
jgi:hypothetical protein